MKDFDIEKDLSIDKYRLDEECLAHSALFYRYADACSEAKKRVGEANDKLKLTCAEANLRIRAEYEKSGKKTTEATIAAEIDKCKAVISCKAAVREAEEVHAKLQVGVSAMETRRSELDNLVKLYCAGYFSVPATGAKIDREMNGVDSARRKSAVRRLNKKEVEND